MICRLNFQGLPVDLVGREINELNQCNFGFADILDENLQLNFDVGNLILSKLF